MLKLYNTLTKKEQIFNPIKEGQVKMYSCGPTVYNYAHIGNLRTYVFNDLLKRSLTYLGFKVKHVMNITDVDDKTIRGSIQQNLSLTEFTRKYEKIFFEDLDELNVIKPDVTPRATDTIPEMIDMIKKLEKKKYAYKTSDGIYYSISKFKNYGKLAGLDKIKTTKERIKADEYDKSSPQDFALWKFYTSQDGNVAWDGKLGKGRPGWHIECSAMSMKYLGETFDIHTGAIDLCFPHHTNEIAQSEAATGKKFVNYWLHAGFLTMNEGKMSKSVGNILYLKELKEKGFSPLDFRYLCLQTHYRKPLEFSLDNLQAAKNALERLKRKISEIKNDNKKGKDKSKTYEKEFSKALESEINIPLSVQVLIKTIDDTQFDSKKKLNLIGRFDKVLGLDLLKEDKMDVPKEVEELAKKREDARKAKNWSESDKLREMIKAKGYSIEDKPEGYRISKL